MFYHFYCRYEQIYLNEYNQPFIIKKMAIVGIYLFLIITGYYLMPREKIETKQYLKSKLMKIYPLYLMSIIIIYISSFSGYLGAEREVNFVSFLANVFMINGFINIPYVDGSHWYLTYMIVFILIASLILFIDKKYSYYTYLILLVINLFLCLVCKLNNNIVLQELMILSGGVYTPIVTIGIIMRNNIDGKFTMKKTRIIILVSCISIYIVNGLFNFICAIIVAYIVWNAINNRFSKLDGCKCIISIGNISYIIYLIHQNIGYMIMNYLNLNFRIDIISLVSITIILIISLSYIMNYIENNMKKIIKINV